jgi:hypothetical protein
MFLLLTDVVSYKALPVKLGFHAVKVISATVFEQSPNF